MPEALSATARRVSKIVNHPTLDAFLNSLLPVVLILLVFSFTRLVDLTRLPVFFDEAAHIQRAQDSLPDDVFLALKQNKWFYSFLLALLRPQGPEAVWLGRSISAILSVITCAGCITLGRLFDSPKIGLLAGVLLTVLPESVFFTRQALVDPTMSAFAMLALVFTVMFTKNRKVIYAGLVGIFISAAYLTKALSIPYFTIPLAAVIVLVRPGRNWWRTGLLAVFSTGLTYAIVRTVLYIARSTGRMPQSRVSVSMTKFSEYIGASLPEIVGKVWQELVQYWDLLLVYFGLPLIILTALSLVLIVMGEKRRALLFMWLPGVVFTGLPILARRPTGALVGRYLIFVSAPFVVLSALSIAGLWRVLSRAAAKSQWAGWVDLVGAALVIALVAMPVPQDTRMIFSPETAHLHPLDRLWYITGLAAGDGRTHAGEYLVHAWKDNDEERIGVVVNFVDTQLEVYLGSRIAFDRQWSDFQDDSGELATWLAEGRPVFFVDRVPDATLPHNPHGAVTEQVASFPMADSTLRVFRVVGAEDDLREEIFHRLFIQPDDARVSSEYLALADKLAADPTPRAIIVYPPNQLDTLQSLLSDQPHLTLHAVGDRWPFESESAAQELAEATQGQAVVEVVFLQETLGDPTRSIERWLARNLFWEGEAWFGPLRLVSYLNGPEEALAPSQVDVVFGDFITLEEATIVDGSVAPGEGLRVALQWHAEGPVEQSYKVFAHVVRADGELVAQHDGFPQGGLSPTDTWSADGDPIADRFVIVLPGDATAGAYTLQVGLYDPETGARQTLAQGGDVVTVGQVVVR